jgi:hypothetical protein
MTQQIIDDAKLAGFGIYRRDAGNIGEIVVITDNGMTDLTVSLKKFAELQRARVAPTVESEPVLQLENGQIFWSAMPSEYTGFLYTNPPSESARIAELEAKLAASDERIDKLAGLLKEARDDVASCMDDAKHLLPYKPHRYDMYVEQLASIDEALKQIGEA